MVRDFGIGDRSSASFWAGIFISSFALAESLTGLAWGGVSDRIGRKPVLLIGCTGTLISLLIVGVSTNFWVALAGRALGGLLSEYLFSRGGVTFANPCSRWQYWCHSDHGG